LHKRTAMIVFLKTSQKRRMRADRMRQKKEGGGEREKTLCVARQGRWKRVKTKPNKVLKRTNHPSSQKRGGKRCWISVWAAVEFRCLLELEEGGEVGVKKIVWFWRGGTIQGGFHHYPEQT